MGMLDGKVAFITGGGCGIGRGCAERLAREGADIAVAEIDLASGEETAGLVRAVGRKAHVVPCNVASEAQVRDAVESSVDALGSLDICIANAGIARAGNLLDMPLKDWQDQLDINATGVFLTCQAAARVMVEQGRGGRIVCMSSLAGELSGGLTWGYSATKAAVRMMVRGWAQELGPFGITVNAIGPGVIETPLAQVLSGEEGGPIRSNLESHIPAGRVGQPSDVAGLVAFLCSPDAAFMSGSYLIMDGGQRDSGFRPVSRPGDPGFEEFQRLMLEAVQRREKLQPLIDER